MIQVLVVVNDCHSGAVQVVILSEQDGFLLSWVLVQLAYVRFSLKNSFSNNSLLLRSLQIYFDIHTQDIFTWFMYLIWNTFMPNLEIVRLWLRLWDCEQEQEQFSGKWMASKRFWEECSHCKKRFEASEMQQEKAATTLNLCLKMHLAVSRTQCQFSSTDFRSIITVL